MSLTNVVHYPAIKNTLKHLLGGKDVVSMARCCSELRTLGPDALEVRIVRLQHAAEAVTKTNNAVIAKI